MNGKSVKYVIPVFMACVGIFGVVRVCIWAELSVENILFTCFSLGATFLSGMLFALYYKLDKKKE